MPNKILRGVKEGVMAKIDKFNFGSIVIDSANIAKLNELTGQKKRVAVLVHITC